MTNHETTKQVFPFPPALMAIDFAALVAIGLCFAELSQKHGEPLGLIPENLVWPILMVSVVVAAICGFLQVRILLSRKNSASKMNE